MGCCGKDDDYTPGPDEAVKKFENRKMTDVLFLILYGGFWVGMFVVCGVAFSRGGVDRLYYDTDAYGFMCGVNNQGSSLARAAPIGAPNNTTDYYPDFSGAKKSYLLDQFDWFGATTLVTGRKVCVEACPSAADPATLCVSKDNEDKWKPSCTSTADATDKNMTCPYARYADYDLAGKQLLPASYGRDQADQWRTDYYPKISADNGGSTVDENTLKLQSLVWGSGPCYPNWLPNVDTLNRCLPDITSVNIADIAKEVASSTVWNSAVEGSLSTDFLETAVGDLMKGMLIIFVAGIIVAAILAGLWMVVLRYMAGLFVWAVVLLLNALTIAVTIYCALKADMISGGTTAVAPSQDPEELDRWEGYTWTAVAFTVGLFLFTLVMIPRIKIAIAILKVACNAVGAVPTVMLWPIMPVLFEVGFLVYWIFVMVFLYSAGDTKTDMYADVSGPTTSFGESAGNLGISVTQITGAKLFSEYTPADAEAPATPNWPNRDETACADDYNCDWAAKWDRDLQYAALYHLFGLFWTNEFILGIGYMVLAMVFAQYYFYRGDRERMGPRPVFNSLKIVGRKHLGSIAVGSFIIAVIKMIRFLVEQTEKQLKQKMGRAADTMAMKLIFGIAKYCLWLVEKIMKFINKNAYIVVAISGRGYCWSAIHAVGLILKNILRFATVNIVGGALLWIGKLVITLGAAVVAFAMSDMAYYSDAEKHPDTALSSPVLVIILSAVIAYFIAEVCLQVYDMGVDTILLCFCEDCEKHSTPQYAPALLMEAIGKGEEYEKQRAAAKGAAKNPEA